VTFIILSFFPRSRAQVEPSQWFLRWMAQRTCFHPRIILGVKTMGDVIRGKYAPKNSPKGGGKNRQFQAKTPLCIDRNISGTISPTNKRFEDRVHTTKGTSWASAITSKQIQHGWRPPSWKSIWRHITAVGGPIWTKFGSLMQNSTPITAK